MALHLYHDAAATQRITEANPDRVQKAVQQGSNLVDEAVVYMASDDHTLTYDALKIRNKGTEPGAPIVVVEYALDNGGQPGQYHAELPLPAGTYIDPHPIWRRVTAPDVWEPFLRVDLFHEWDEARFVAE